MLQRFGIGWRLYGSFSVLLLMMAVVAGAGVLVVQRLGKDLRTVYEERAVPVEMVSHLNHLLQRNRVLVMDMLVNPGNANVQSSVDELLANAAVFDQRLAAFEAIERPAELVDLTLRFKRVYGEYMDRGLLAAGRAMKANDFDEAQFVYLNTISTQEPEVRAIMDELMQRQIAMAGQEYRDAQGTIDRALWGMPSVLVVALLLGGVLAWAMTQSVTRPIARAVVLAEQVADGDLRGNQNPSTPGRDEMARLMAELVGMRTRLAELVSDVRQSSAQIASGTREMAKGVADLSQRTEGQAARLQEANTSLQRMRQVTTEHAQAAQRVSHIAREANASAVTGGEVVTTLIGQIEAMAASSRRITEITAVIDSIAFQTNILALNAAVEAARAGDMGRGFAVVAGEVRALAQRSSRAAGEIKDLIGDTTQAMAQVTAMASEAGGRVQHIIGQVEDVDRLMGRVSDAGAEQAAQLAHISEAMNAIDGMTQRNAALVEENAAATTELSHQASELDAQVAVFKLDRSEPSAVADAVPAEDHFRMSPRQRYLIST